MKFTEAKLEEAIIGLLGDQGLRSFAPFLSAEFDGVREANFNAN